MPFSYDESILEQCRELRENKGFSYREIMEKTGITTSTIYKWARVENWKKGDISEPRSRARDNLSTEDSKIEAPEAYCTKMLMWIEPYSCAVNKLEKRPLCIGCINKVPPGVMEMVQRNRKRALLEKRGAGKERNYSPCEVDGCLEFYYGKGKCKKHYQEEYYQNNKEAIKDYQKEYNRKKSVVGGD